MSQPTRTSQDSDRAVARAFIAAAAEAGVIEDDIREALLEFASRLYVPPAAAEPHPEPSALVIRANQLAVELHKVGPRHRAKARAIRVRLTRALLLGDAAAVEVELAAAEELIRRGAPQPAAAHTSVARPAPPQGRAPSPTSPAPTPRPAAPVPVKPPAPPRPPVFAGAAPRIRAAWSALSADFAAHTLTYLGVLLAVVVIFVFFAFGYFGEAVQREYLRPPIFVALPTFFFWLAWLLRSRLRLPVAANAVGLIGGLTLPVMLSALFRDGYHLPPDIEGSARWAAYAVVGLISAGVYLALTTRHRVYAYLVAPVLWAAAGALGLYWSSGLSGPQLFTVLGAIVLGLALASRGRATRLGKILSVPTIRTGVVAAPFVFVVSLIFAFDDAVAAGIVSPAFSDLAWPSAIAAALMAAVLGLASGTEFAWDGLGPRARDGFMAGLRIGAYLSAGAALLLALALDVTTGWLGVALVGYGLGVWGLDRVVGGTGSGALWIARVAAATGMVMAIAEPEATIAAWSVAALMGAARAVAPSSGRLDSLVGPLETPIARRATYWIPLFVVVVAGVARLVPAVEIPLVFLIAATAAVALRELPSRLAELRSLATAPAAAFAAGTVLVAAVLHADRSPYTTAEIGWGLAALALIAGLTMYPWIWRFPFVAVTAVGSAWALLVAALEPGTYGTVMLLTSILIGAGLVSTAAGFVRRWHAWAVPHGIAGHLAVFGAVGVSAGIEDALLLAVGAIVALHGVEAVLIERRSVPFIEILAGNRVGAELLRHYPAVVTLIGLLPFVVLAGRQAAWMRADPARLALLLSGLGAVYAVGAWRWWRFATKTTALVLGYGSVAGALFLAGTVEQLQLVALGAGAVSTCMLALALRAPVASVIAWILAFGAVVTAGATAGLDPAYGYRPLLATALVVAAGASGAIGYQRRRARPLAWVVVPGIVSAVAVVVGMAGAIGDGHWLWAWATGAALTTLALTMTLRVGPLAFLGWAYGLTAYVDLLTDRIEGDPVWLLPYAAALVGVSGVLPGRRSWRFRAEPAVPTLLSGLAIAAAAVVLGIVEGAPAAPLAWTALILIGVAAIRAEISWLHGSAALLIGAGADLGAGWVPAGFATAAGLETAATELRRDRTEARTYAWAAAALGGAGYISLLDWLDPAPATTITITLASGALLSAAAAWWYARPAAAPDHRWMLPCAALGQSALLGAGFYGDAVLAQPEAQLTWAAVAAADGIIVGAVGTLRRSRDAVWLASGLLGLAAWAAIAGAQMTAWAQTWIWAGAGITLLGAWTWQMVRSPSERLDLWRWPGFALAQVAATASAAVALDTVAAPDRFLPLLVLAAAEAAAFGTVATALLAVRYAFVSVGFATAAGVAAVEWRQLGQPQIWLWLGTMVAGALVAAWASRAEADGARRMWAWPLHMSVLVSGVLAAVAGVRLLDPEGARLLISGILALGGIHTLSNRDHLQELFETRIAAPLLFTAAAAMSVSVLDPDGAGTVPALLGVAMVGLGALARAGAVKNLNRVGWGIAGLGMSSTAMVGAAILYSIASAEVGYVLIATGGGFAAYAITAHQLVAIHAAALNWLAAALVITADRWGVEFHATVLAVAVVLLIMLEVERFRRGQEGLSQPAWLGAAEWVAMATPVTLAAAEMLVTSLAYGLLLAAEGAALTVWGALTTTRRRALLGLAAITTAILVPVLVPLIRGLRGGLTGGTWLVVGAIAAVVFITAGSMIERFRVSIGSRLARWADIMRDWE